MIKMLRCGLLVFFWTVLDVDFSAGALCARHGARTIYYPPTQSCLFVIKTHFEDFIRGGFDKPCTRYGGRLYNNVTSKLATANSEDFIDFLRGFMKYSSIDVVLVQLNKSVPAFSEALKEYRDQHDRGRPYRGRYFDDGVILVTDTGWESVYHKYFGYVICQTEPGLPDPPSCPKGAAVTIHTKDSLTLHWEPGFTEGLNQSFVIKFQACQGVTPARCLPDDVTEIQQNVNFGKMNYTFTLTDPKPRTDYTFTVDAKNPTGTSANCTVNKITVTTGNDGFIVDTVAPAAALTKILNEVTKETESDTNVAAIILGALFVVAVCASIVLAFLYVKLWRGGHNEDTHGISISELQKNLPDSTPAPEKTHQEAFVTKKSSKKENIAQTKGNNDKGMKRGQSYQSKGEKSQNVQRKKTTQSTEDNETQYENFNVAENVYERVEALADNRTSQHFYSPYVAIKT